MSQGSGLPASDQKPQPSGQQSNQKWDSSSGTSVPCAYAAPVLGKRREAVPVLPACCGSHMVPLMLHRASPVSEMPSLLSAARALLLQHSLCRNSSASEMPQRDASLKEMSPPPAQSGLCHLLFWLAIGSRWGFRQFSSLQLLLYILKLSGVTAFRKLLFTHPGVMSHLLGDLPLMDLPLGFSCCFLVPDTVTGASWG